MRLVRRVGAVALAVASAGVLAVPLGAQIPATTPNIQPESEALERVEVREIEFRGVEAVEEEELREGIVTEASSCNSLVFRVTFCIVSTAPAFYTHRYLDREELALDVLRIRVYYWRRGYRDVRVDAELVPLDEDDVRVVFQVAEGAPILVENIAVTGADSILPEDPRQELLLLEPGEPLSLPALDSSMVRVRNALWDRGYADAVVDSLITIDTVARRASVIIAAEPRYQVRVGSVVIRGLTRLDQTTVYRSLTLRPGEMYRRDQVLLTQRNLYESNLFQYANVEAVGEDSVKTLVVTVREGDLQTARLAAGFNTVDYVQVDGRYTNFNFFGGARRLQVSAALGNLFASALEDEFIFRRIPEPDGFGGDRSPFLRPNWQASVDLRQAWFRSPLNTLSGNVFAHRRSTPNVVVDRGQGASVAFNRLVAMGANAGGSYRFEVTQVEAADIYFCANFGVCDPATIAAVSSAQRLSPLSVLGTINRTDDPLAPTRGFIARVDLEHASGYTGSDFRYNRASAEGSMYRSVGRGTLAGHLRVGWAGALASSAEALGIPQLTDAGTLHPRKRFYAGGARSVRGFTENQLGPRVLTIAPSRLRIDSVATGPNMLPDTAYFCPPSVPITQCPLDAAGLEDQAFFPRPVGAEAIVEANIEYRVPVWGPLKVAAFLDGALLAPGETGLVRFDGNFMAVTPGVGVRYMSPVGPIRIDVGYNPTQADDLPVLTQVVVDGEPQLVQVIGTGTRANPQERTFSPFQTFLSRLTLHLSIGEAF